MLGVKVHFMTNYRCLNPEFESLLYENLFLNYVISPNCVVTTRVKYLNDSSICGTKDTDLTIIVEIEVILFNNYVVLLPTFNCLIVSNFLHII